jgi:hypothetical protein
VDRARACGDPSRRPDTAEAKLGNADWTPVFADALSALQPKKRADALALLEDLTYLETQQLVFALSHGVEDVFDAFSEAHKGGTLARFNGDKPWKETCVDERSHIRLPAAPAAPIT